MVLKLIDFGRAVDLHLFPEGTTFTANCYTDSFQCVEMKAGRRWTYQVLSETRDFIPFGLQFLHG